MRRRRPRTAARVALLAGVLACGQAAARVSPEAGFVLLRESIGARAAAMGDAFTALSDDQTAVYRNPASAAEMSRKDFVLAHQEGIAGIRQSYAGWAYGNGRHGVGLSLGIHTAGGIEARSGPTALPSGTFHAFELNAALTYARAFAGGVAGGFSAHVLHEDLASDRASGFSVDAGLLVATGIEGLRLGVSARNLGRMERLDRERVRLPRTYHVGAAFRRSPLTVAVDARVPEHGTRGVHVGIEYAPHEALLLRGGHQTGHDTRGLSFGLGLRRGNWRIDYAFVPHDLDLGGGHRVSLGIR